MEKLARSYIEKRVQQTRTGSSDYISGFIFQRTEETRAEHARHEAQCGFPESTASHLHSDDTLSVSQKGEILAEAYARSAERSAELVTIFVSASLKEYYQRKSQRLKRIAQGLTRAAQKLQNS